MEGYQWGGGGGKGTGNKKHKIGEIKNSIGNRKPKKLYVQPMDMN